MPLPPLLLPLPGSGAAASRRDGGATGVGCRQRGGEEARLRGGALSPKVRRDGRAAVGGQASRRAAAAQEAPSPNVRSHTCTDPPCGPGQRLVWPCKRHLGPGPHGSESSQHGRAHRGCSNGDRLHDVRRAQMGQRGRPVLGKQGDASAAGTSCPCKHSAVLLLNFDRCPAGISNSCRPGSAEDQQP